jgi:CheY-like chemotaxis protein
MMETSVSTLVMLLVEDNPADVAFFKEAVADAQLEATIHVVGDGDKALRFLRRQAPYADASRPDVIVLDLNLPTRSGQEVLVEVAADTELNTIPVAILTTSTSERCVCDLYPSGRCLYFTKTDEFERLQDTVRQIAAHAQRTHGDE